MSCKLLTPHRFRPTCLLLLTESENSAFAITKIRKWSSIIQWAVNWHLTKLEIAHRPLWKITNGYKIWTVVHTAGCKLLTSYKFGPTCLWELENSASAIMKNQKKVEFFLKSYRSGTLHSLIFCYYNFKIPTEQNDHIRIVSHYAPAKPLISIQKEAVQN